MLNAMASFSLLSGEWPQKSCVGTQWTCCREKAVCALVPQRTTAWCRHCGDTSVRSALRASMPPLPTLRNWPAECPSPNSTGMQTPGRGRERSQAGAHGLGNDEVANHQVGSWNPQRLLDSRLLPGIPWLLARMLALAARVRRHRLCPKQGYLFS